VFLLMVARTIIYNDMQKRGVINIIVYFNYILHKEYMWLDMRGLMN